jgi:hypothetical protein
MSEHNKKENQEQELGPEQLEGVAGGVIAVSHEIKAPEPPSMVSKMAAMNMSVKDDPSTLP